jgi:hypothetical protein
MFVRSEGGDGWGFVVAKGPLLAFDIETTGLRMGADTVTCACAYDPDNGIEEVFLFAPSDSDSESLAKREGFMGLLDAAERLCAFNGVRFDVAFLARSWGVPGARVGGWVRKLVDPFEASKLALGRTFSLERLLRCNGLQGKTGSGLQAVAMAREGRWRELGEYCMHDTRVTHAAAALGTVALPLHQMGAGRRAGSTSAASQYQSSRALAPSVGGACSGQATSSRVVSTSSAGSGGK